MASRSRIGARGELSTILLSRSRNFIDFFSSFLVMGRLFPQQLILRAPFTGSHAEKSRVRVAIHGQRLTAFGWRRRTSAHRQSRRRQIDRRSLGGSGHHQKLSGNKARATSAAAAMGNRNRSTVHENHFGICSQFNSLAAKRKISCMIQRLQKSTNLSFPTHFPSPAPFIK